MSQREVCELFNTPAGCPRGAYCNRRHERTSTTSSSRSPIPGGSSNPPPQLLNVPNGVCRFFWNSGNCKFTNCRFKHVHQSDSASSTPGPTPPVTSLQSPPLSQPPTLIPPLEAANARYQLYNIFFQPNYKFANPAFINWFVNILASCSEANEWTKQDSNVLLLLVTEEHGLLRMQDVIAHGGVTTSPSEPAKVSFQGCYIHILMYLTSDLVLTSSLQANINVLYGIIHRQYDTIEAILETCLGEIIDSRQIPAVSRNAVRTVNFPEIFGAVIGLINEYLTRYKSAIREHSGIPQLVSHIVKWFDTWSASSHRFEDTWAPETDQARKYTISALRRDLERVCAIVARERATVLQYKPKTSRTDQSGQQLALLATYVPSGHLRPDGPRHDNDHADILQISVEPSRAELVCTVCELFNTPAGCCRGASCNRRHERASTPSSSFSPTPGGSFNPRPQLLNVPNGVCHCQFFWNSGNCKFTNCRFRQVHQSDSASSTPGPTPPVTSLQSLPLSQPPTLIPPLKAANARYQLYNTFFQPDYKFANPAFINWFVNILASCSEANEWTKQDSNELLRLVTEEHGLLRMQDVIAYGGVTTSPSEPAKVSFQGCYIHILVYLTSDLVLTSSLQANINVLYGIIHQQYDTIEAILETCLGEVIDSRRIPAVSRDAVRAVNFPEIFGAVVGLINEYLTRYKSAIQEHSGIPQLVSHIVKWFDTWSASSHRFEDTWAPETDQARKHTISALRRDLERVCAIVTQERVTVLRYPPKTNHTDKSGQQLALLATYIPPGHLRLEGPRHDNDHADILQISVEPSQAELVCTVPPYLPANVAAGPHHHRSDSIERLLDIQFRLLREDLLAPLKAAISHVKSDLEETKKPTVLSSIITKKGGRYRGQLDYHNAVMFSVYTNVRFGNITTDRRGLASTLVFDTPPGAARNATASQRAAFWERMGSKRLMPGGLVALVWRTPRSTSIYLGVIASPAKDLVASARASASVLAIRISFFDPAIEVRILEWYQRRDANLNDVRILVEAPVMYEAVRPFLEALKVKPTSIPFSKYLVLREGSLSSTPVDPPRNATDPRFSWDLSSLLPEGHTLRVAARDAASIANAREVLRNESTLDPSQAEAMVDSLTREVSLIHGLPGTGKSYIATRLLQVLIKNNVSRIIMIAFTDHALDHLLGNVLDAGITKKVARLGSRSADERTTPYSLEAMERMSGNHMHEINIYEIRREMKDIEEEFAEVVATLNGGAVDPEGLLLWLDLHHPGQSQELTDPPQWVNLLRHEQYDWKTTSGRKGKLAKNTTEFNHTEYGFWVNGLDLDLLGPPEFVDGHNAGGQGDIPENQFAVLGTDASDDGADELLSQEAIYRENLVSWFASHELADIPELPISDRSLDILIHDDDVWDMSRLERLKLSQYWESSARAIGFESDVEVFKDLKRKYAELQQQLDAYNTEARLQLLASLDIIGCTTTGAAKLTRLLKSLRPTVMLVEEAGQVLEAHILGSLAPSVQHLIMIGDPLQLRPTIRNYPLSMDRPTGKQMYRFDQSLMERLSSSGLSMSRLDVQRRMRPDISTLVKHTSYPDLKDSDHVLGYPPVRGIAHNVFFIDHSHPERGGDDAFSKFNEYEVRMTKHIVLHLLRQGIYTKPKSIVVLCMHLGQLAKLREAFAACKVTITLDSRDQEALLDREGDTNVPSDSILVQEVQPQRQVLLRTVDNYQGEEADIIILSLVRNNTEGGGQGGIGFLKSINRTNVALSRAKHGMIIMGNAELLSSHSDMWRTVIDDLREARRLGPGLPISCYNHPNYVKYITKPEMIPLLSPDGGCLRPCSKRLDCGHSCPSKVNVIRMITRRCAVTNVVGKAVFKVTLVTLNAGYLAETVNGQLPKWDYRVATSRIMCPAICLHDLMKYIALLSSIVHFPTASIRPIWLVRQNPVNSAVPNFVTPKEPAALNDALHDAGNATSSPRVTSRRQSVGSPVPITFVTPATRISSVSILACNHVQLVTSAMTVPLSAGRVAFITVANAAARRRARRVLSHVHGHVPISRARFPVDRYALASLAIYAARNSSNVATAARRCVENHAKFNFASNATVVDVIMNNTIADIDPDSDELDSILIRLACGHVFTAETLDGICELRKFYSSTPDGSWTGLRPPPAGSAPVPPTCPICRGSITARRYGRVCKRANLDMLELTVATKMSKDLNELGRRVTGLDVQGLLDSVCAISIPEEAKALEPQEKKKIQRLREANTKKELPLDSKCLRRLNMHGMLGNENQEWGQSLKELLDVYDAVSAVAATRSAHATAYDAAISMLYDRELRRVHASPRPPPHPEGVAIATAKRLIGTDPPNADKRFRVEAIWLSMELRYILGGATLARLEILKRHTGNGNDQRLTLWSDFTDLIFRSCVDDAQLAAKITADTGAAVQSLEATMKTCRAIQELTKAKCSISEARGHFTEEREHWLSIATRLKAGAEVHGRKAQEDLLHKRPSGDLRQVIDEKLTIPLNSLLEKWKELINSLSRTTFQSAPPSREELAAIIKVFGDTHRGRWYTCPNGHIFSIGECGGAMQASRCIECGEAVGGGNHTLLGTNRRANLMEIIATEQGQARSPWGWGRGT